MREKCQAGGRYLEFFFQLRLELLCPRGQYQPGGQRGRASQQHGVGTIEELVAKKLIVLPAPVNLLCGAGVGHRKEGIYCSLDISVLPIGPWGFRISYAQPFLFLSFWGLL